MAHIENQITKALPDALHVVACVSNPARYHSRYRLAREFAERMSGTPRVSVTLVECAFGSRDFELPSTIRVRTNSEAWCKENLLNIGIRTLPTDWKYCAILDADIEFRHEHWAHETMQQLQHAPVVQPWQQCLDLGPSGNVMGVHQSFGSLHATGKPMQRSSGEPYAFGHPGFAWAFTRAWYERCGGLLDFAILGSGDHHMARAMIGDVDSTIHAKMSPAFFRKCHEWQARASRETRGNVGFSPGRIEHHFHGPKGRRMYRERWQILVDHRFDPDKHVAYNDHGVIGIVDNDPLERAIVRYNRERAEDSIEET